MTSYPESTDPLVQALQRLLVREGGHITVADEAGINDQSLYQIATCKVDAKTGTPKGVGPSIRRRLTRRYPDWLAPADSTPSIATATPDLAALLASAVAAMPVARWRSVRAQLDDLASHPELHDDVVHELRALLADTPTKQPAAA